MARAGYEADRSWGRESIASDLGASLFNLWAGIMILHTGRAIEPHDLLTAWSLDPLVLGGLAIAAVGYRRGVRAIWRHAGHGRGVRPWRVHAFAVGIGTLFVALVSPVHALGEALFSGHMVQHLLLTVVAAPLLVLGSPVVAGLWALPPASRGRLVRRWRRARHVRRGTGIVLHPIVAWLLSTSVLWAWHLPVLYDSAVRNDAVHALEHVSLLAVSVLFWRAVLDPAGPLRRAPGVGMLYLFGAAMQGGGLGALLTLADSPWYTAHETTTAAWGLTPLQDQHLAGGIMWMPAGLVYTAAYAFLFVSWMNEAERRVQRLEAADTRL